MGSTSFGETELKRRIYFIYRSSNVTNTWCYLRINLVFVRIFVQKTISNRSKRALPHSIPSLGRDSRFSWISGMQSSRDGKMSLRKMFLWVVDDDRSLLRTRFYRVLQITWAVRGSCVSFPFFPRTIHTARRSTPCWLIETVVEGTIACNCSFRETEAPFRFLRTMARSAFRSLRSRQVFSPRSISLFTVDRVYWNSLGLLIFFQRCAWATDQMDFFCASITAYASSPRFIIHPWNNWNRTIRQRKVRF